MSHKTHVTWQRKHAEVAASLERERDLGLKLEIGDPALVEPDEPSLQMIQQRLSRLTLDRGRVWRRLSMVNPLEGNRVVLSTAPMTEEGVPGDPSTAPESGLQANMVLYAFREGELPLSEEERIHVPVAYLGEFLVTDVQAGTVTLQFTLPLDGQQRTLLQDGGATVALYEMMPGDAHRVFSDTDTVGQPLDNSTDQPVFGSMDEQQLRAVFSSVTGLAADDALLTSLVTPYLKDGYAASEQDVNVYPNNVWMKLEFEKAHDVRVDSENLDPGVSGGFFDPQGYAAVLPLRAGETGNASIRDNDIGLFPYAHESDKLAVDELVSSGVARKIGPVYVRSLRDYEEAFHDIQDRFIKRQEDIVRVQRDIENLNTTIAKTQEQTAYRQEERQKLKEDLAGYARDNEKMDQLVAALESQKTTLQEELSELYRTNLALNQQLETYSARLTEELNRRAASVAAK
jgi:hypothetical protein